MSRLAGDDPKNCGCQRKPSICFTSPNMVLVTVDINVKQNWHDLVRTDMGLYRRDVANTCSYQGSQLIVCIVPK